MRNISVLLAATITALLMLDKATAIDYYVSASTGNDDRSGLNELVAWRTLDRVKLAKLVPGDQLLLKSGDVFYGMLTIAAQGTKQDQIVVSSYGEGEPPTIDGSGCEACIRLFNPANIVLRSLRLVNPGGQYGIRLTAKNAGELENVSIESMEITNVFKPAWDKSEDSGHGPDKYYGGINAEVLFGKMPSWWNGLTIQGCDIHDLGTCGLSIGSEYPLHEKRRSQEGRATKAFPIKNVRIENNKFFDIARDGAIIRQCDNAVLVHNRVIRTGRVSTSNGIWLWDSRNSVIRSNIGSECGVKNFVDGGPFSIDYYCESCIIENNYSHDNEGPSFMVFGNHGTGKGTIVRGNVSYNDARAESKSGFGAVSMISTVSETLVEGNIVIAGPDTQVLVGHHKWQGLPTDVTYRGNIFIGNGKAVVEESVLTGGHFDSNLFINVPALPRGVTSEPAEVGLALMPALQRHAKIQEQSNFYNEDD